MPHAGADFPLPDYKTAGAAGIDLMTTQDVHMKPFERCLVSTGFLVEIPEGYEGQIRPRSGNALNYGVTVLNTPGTIDSDYRGEIKVILFNSNSGARVDFERGDRIAQLVIAPVSRAKIEEVEDLDRTDRGERGYGSTGR
jgi:dUTP pyrophosphatase